MPGEVENLGCRREFPERSYERCGNPAGYIVWGKLFPKEALGPRCRACLEDQCGHRAPVDPAYAIYHLAGDDVQPGGPSGDEEDWPALYITPIRRDGEVAGFHANDAYGAAELRRNGHGPARRYLPATSSKAIADELYRMQGAYETSANLAIKRTCGELGQQREGGLPSEEANLVDHVLQEFVRVGKELSQALAAGLSDEDRERLKQIARTVEMGTNYPPAHQKEDAAFLRKLATPKEEDQGFYFTCCNWDKLSPESKAAVEQVVQAAAGRLDSPLSEEEQAEYEAARRSIVEARDAHPSGAQGEEKCERCRHRGGAMSEVRIALADPERVLLEEIADTRMKREDVALSYALALRAGDDLDWPKINRAIVDRWSLSALKWIKGFAWKKAKDPDSNTREEAGE